MEGDQEDSEYFKDDVTLHCKDGNVDGLKFVLSINSPYFKDLFKAHPKMTDVDLSDVHSYDMMKVLDMIYDGSANVHRQYIQRFLQTVAMLKMPIQLKAPVGEEQLYRCRMGVTDTQSVTDTQIVSFEIFKKRR